MMELQPGIVRINSPIPFHLLFVDVYTMESGDVRKMAAEMGENPMRPFNSRDKGRSMDLR